jgi:hypothetical protein
MRFCKGDASLLTSLVYLQVLSSTGGFGLGGHSKLGYHDVVVVVLVALSSLTDWTDPLHIITFIFANIMNQTIMRRRDIECLLFTQKRVLMACRGEPKPCSSKLARFGTYPLDHCGKGGTGGNGV